MPFMAPLRFMRARSRTAWGAISRVGHRRSSTGASTNQKSRQPPSPLGKGVRKPEATHVRSEPHGARQHSLPGGHPLGGHGTVFCNGDRSRAQTVAPPSGTAWPKAAFPLGIATGNRYLEDAAGRPFLIHGDTAWSLIAQLTLEDAGRYLQDRRARGFNTILVNLLEHMFSSKAPATFMASRLSSGLTISARPMKRTSPTSTGFFGWRPRTASWSCSRLRTSDTAVAPRVGTRQSSKRTRHAARVRSVSRPPLLWFLKHHLGPRR